MVEGGGVEKGACNQENGLGGYPRCREGWWDGLYAREREPGASACANEGCPPVEGVGGGEGLCSRERCASVERVCVWGGGYGPAVRMGAVHRHVLFFSMHSSSLASYMPPPA